MALKDNSDRFKRRMYDALIKVNKFAGEDFINTARNRVDQTIYNRKPREPWELTGNLRSSIGYSILYEGGIVFDSFPGAGKGVVEGKKLAKLVGENTRGHSLVAVAGMNYAAAVESKGYDVISDSVKKLRHTHHRIMTEALKKLAHEAG